MFGSFWWFPFFAAAGALMIAVWVIVFIFWIYMIVDCARRKFLNKTEKIIWIVVVVLGSWIGALVYLLVVRMNNPKGISK